MEGNQVIDPGQGSVLAKLKPARIILPVIIGLGVVAWFIATEISAESLSVIHFDLFVLLWILIAFCFMIGRDLGYIIRIRILSGNELSFRQAFRIIMLWEFTSAITPSTVGGTAVAVIFLNREGITIGKSTAIVLATSFLDELYFVIMFPLILLLVGPQILFSTSLDGTGAVILNNLIYIAVTGYIIILGWVLFVGYGLFFNPAGIKRTLTSVFSLRFLKRWSEGAEKAGDDIISGSNQLKHQPFSFWLKAGAATFLSWTSRYWVLNAILLAFFTVRDHFLIFARQLVTWIMMIISPTPGGSGFAELILSRYISDTIPAEHANAAGLALAMAIIWRIITYYPYLVIGASILPGWIQRNFISPVAKEK